MRLFVIVVLMFLTFAAGACFYPVSGEYEVPEAPGVVVLDTDAGQSDVAVSVRPAGPPRNHKDSGVDP